MSDPTQTAKPSYDEVSMLALIAVHVAHDLERGDVNNAFEGVALFRAYAYAIFAGRGEFEGFMRWGDAVPWAETLKDGIARLRLAPKTHREAHTRRLEQAIVSFHVAAAKEAAEAKP